MSNLSDTNRATAQEIADTLQDAVYFVNRMEVAPVKTYHQVVACLIDGMHELNVILDLNASRQPLDYRRMFKKVYRHLADALEHMEKYQDVYENSFKQVSKCVELAKGVVDWMEAVSTPL